MRPRSIAAGISLAGLLALLCGAGPADEGYAPVTPPPALDAALRLSIRAVRDWVEDRDFASAARDAQGLAVLAHVYEHQGGDPGWREKTATLLAACTRLADAARKKDAAACAAALRECEGLLGELARRAPGARTATKDFKPRGGTTTWMLLLDAAYADAKTARSAREMELLARAVAEESNAAQHLRADARWRQMFADVRGAALDAADRAGADDLAGAKAALKSVYHRCEACHDLTRKK